MVTMPLSLPQSLSLSRPSSSLRKTSPFPFRYSNNNNSNFRVVFSPSPSRFRASASSSSPEKLKLQRFASVSSSRGQETTSVGVPQGSVPPPSTQIGSPLFWIGVGVGLSVVFTWVAGILKKYAMQQAFKTLMGQMNTQNNQFNNAAFSPGTPFPFPPPSPSPSGLASTPRPAAFQPAVTVDVAATTVEATPAADVKDETEQKTEAKKFAFVDVSPEETKQKSPFESSLKDAEETISSNEGPTAGVSQNGTTSKHGVGASQESPPRQESTISVEALEKMMEDPTVQKMVYPYLPEEMRNPTTFKWMLQNPQYRQQLEDMLKNMGGNSQWDNRVMDSLKNFDLSSPDVKQQFDQIGLTPEEVISKIMANPDVALAFQNPRVQQAIMDCSQNPLSIAKYQNDKEVMDVFNKISELFPGVTGSP
ncbi:protein TIC 40, chloroplastic [Morus notabilis]|uniref:protein TIC 40, chloroplastic n=1 Tax=Morus notabilis TaxID=981085 RepID=UPI000CED3393|nr:protein TIC 40, chloroplastic [Morus notabilis]